MMQTSQLKTCNPLSSDNSKKNKKKRRTHLMKIQQIYHEDIAEQDKETITSELKKVRLQIQDIQKDLEQIEEVLFKLKENEKYLKYLFTDIKQPKEVALFYELSYKYDTLKGSQLTEKYIFKDYISIYSLISSNIVNLRAYQDTLIQSYFRGEQE